MEARTFCFGYFNPYHRGAVSFTGYVSKKDRERCEREVTCRHTVILKREIKTLQKTFVANGIRDKTFSLEIMEDEPLHEEEIERIEGIFSGAYGVMRGCDASCSHAGALPLIFSK